MFPNTQNTTNTTTLETTGNGQCSAVPCSSVLQSTVQYLVCEVVDELGVLAILPHESLPELEHRRVQGHGPMPLEDGRDDAKGALPDGHLVREEVSRTLQGMYPWHATFLDGHLVGNKVSSTL